MSPYHQPQSRADLIFQISGGASVGVAPGPVPDIEQAVERKSVRIAWCRAQARLSGTPALLVITVEVKVSSDYKPPPLVRPITDVLCTFAFGRRFFSANQPGIVSLIEPPNLIRTRR